MADTNLDSLVLVSSLKVGSTTVFSSVLTGSVTWNASSIAVGGMEAKDVTVTGAALGDFVIASPSLDITDLTLTATVTAANTVTLVLANNTAGAVDLASGTFYVLVLKR